MSFSGPGTLKGEMKIRGRVQIAYTVQGIYAFRSIMDAGAMLAFGSDSPVEDLNPLSGFYAGGREDSILSSSC
jgi:predicted amidohydrolase YtcJ